MKVVLQRVSRAEVRANGERTGLIGRGLLLLVGIHRDDTEEILRWVCNKLLSLRVFRDGEGKMNRSVTDVGGEILVVSQFTVFGDTNRGTRPGFTDAADPRKAERFYERTIELLRENSTLKVETGRFGAMMEVELINDGPVTLIIER